MNQETGKYIIIIGAIAIISGVIIYFFHDSFKWIGRLPGDVRIRNNNYRFYFPWVTMLVISIFFTLLINLMRKFL